MKSPTKYDYSIEEIKQQLILCCLDFNAEKFLPYLLASNVSVQFPNKIRFYKCLKKSLKCAETRTIGPLKLKIEKEPWEKDEKLITFNFYDLVHQHSRINLKVKEEDEILILNILPF